ncbi:hypothetical protein B0H11DRAFT_1909024 [Mycena galericulata]|nr:hypothetical protein B0H11DRAFT_1909024 [Mycena galericulata]
MEVILDSPRQLIYEFLALILVGPILSLSILSYLTYLHCGHGKAPCQYPMLKRVAHNEYPTKLVYVSSWATNVKYKGEKGQWGGEAWHTFVLMENPGSRPFEKYNNGREIRGDGGGRIAPSVFTR